MVRNLAAMQDTQLRSLGWEDPLEKRIATHSGILAWRIPWTEESGGLQSMGLHSQTGLKGLSTAHLQALRGQLWGEGHYSTYHTEGSDHVQSHIDFNALPRKSHFTFNWSIKSHGHKSLQ